MLYTYITYIYIYIYIYTHMHTHNGILFSCKKNEIMPFIATSVDLRDNHTKWSKSDKDKYRRISPIYDILKND